MKRRVQRVKAAVNWIRQVVEVSHLNSRKHRGYIWT